MRSIPEIVALQTALTVKRLYEGAIDGLPGPLTMTGLVRSVSHPRAPADRIRRIGAEAYARLDMWLIHYAPLRLAHFFGQASHETAGFLFLEELGGPAYFARYDGRTDLGNIRPGDGALFHGRGIFQLTGRANYRLYGRRAGLDLEGNPGQAAEPECSVRLAIDYWSTKGLTALADNDNCPGITRAINGGSNGLADRQARTDSLKRLLACA